MNMKQNKKTDMSVVMYFVKKNIFTKKIRGLFFLCFFGVVSVMSFIFISVIYANKDASLTKKYNDKIYANPDKTRIAVIKKDGSSFDKNDIEKLNKISYVRMADICDRADDINYYCDEGKDYQYSYGTVNKNSVSEFNRIVTYAKGIKKAVSADRNIEFLKADKFMKSSSCINGSMLAAGRLPEKNNEVVMYSKDTSVVGQTKRFYFTAKNIWDADDYYYEDMKITGCLKEKTTQAYFSTSLCNMLTSQSDEAEFTLFYQYLKELGWFLGKAQVRPVHSETRDEGLYDSVQDIRGDKKALKEYDARWGIASGEKARASCNMTVWLSGADVNTIKEDVKALRGKALIYIKKRKSDGNLSNKKDSLKLELTDEMTDYSGTFLEISKHLYYQYFKNESRQASVYITHYAKTDKVIDAINKADKKYQAVSAYRMSLEGYDNDKISERLATLGIAFVVLVFMAILEVAILSAVMKISIKDWRTFRQLGMKSAGIKKINLVEMLIYCMSAVVITVIAANAAAEIGSASVSDITAYYNAVVYIIYLLYNIVVCVITSKRFCDTI